MPLDTLKEWDEECRNLEHEIAQSSGVSHFWRPHRAVRYWESRLRTGQRRLLRFLLSMRRFALAGKTVDPGMASSRHWVGNLARVMQEYYVEHCKAKMNLFWLNEIFHLMGSTGNRKTNPLIDDFDVETFAKRAEWLLQAEQALSDQYRRCVSQKLLLDQRHAALLSGQQNLLALNGRLYIPSSIRRALGGSSDTFLDQLPRLKSPRAKKVKSR